MIDTIEEALNPLFLATFIFGGGILRYLDQPRYRLSIFYILTVWSVYAFAFYYVKIQFSLRDLNGFLTSFTLAINLFVTFISIIIAVCEYEKFYMCIRKLDVVNNTLEELGTPKEYHRLRNLIKWALIILFFTSCIIWIFDSLLCLEQYNDIKAVLIPIVLEYSIQINTIMDIMFMLLLRYLGSRLDKINDHIIQLLETEACDVRFKWKKSLVVNRYNIQSIGNRKRVLWTLIHLHLELCRIAREINGFFGTQMTLQMLSYFIVLIGMFYSQYNTILHLKKMYKYVTIKILWQLSSDMWFFIVLVKLLLLNHICENVSAKAQKTKNVINELTNLTCFAEIRKDISQFVLQILLQPLKFSGLDMFYFGYDFIRKFFVWILTAVIFMVQIDIGLTPKEKIS